MDSSRKTAYRFIVLMGVVSLFGDVTYEGARSITGPYLAILGAGAGAVGFVAGFGEFMGYALRMASGYFADRTRAYWPLTFIGYGLMFAIPMLAIAGSWQVAGVLIVLERAGKAIRSPSRDAILSHAAARVGTGWGFGIHEFLDQLGAAAGPLVFTFVFLLRGDYKSGFHILWIPAAMSILFLLLASRKLPHPEKLETPSPVAADTKGLSRLFWVYSLFTFLSVAGVVNFQIISYHLKMDRIVPDVQIPVLYIVAMGTDAVVALLMGKLYDRVGISCVALASLVSIPIPFLSFKGSLLHPAAGVVLWGASLGVHETVMRAAIADLSDPGRRGFAYGVFNTIYGLAFFAGSAIMGQLYEISVNWLIAFAVAAEAASLAVFAAFYIYGGGQRRRAWRL